METHILAVYSIPLYPDSQHLSYSTSYKLSLITYSPMYRMYRNNDYPLISQVLCNNQWQIQDGAFGANPPPSRNCIQDRDTLIEQSITLIKQSQCS